VEESPLDQWEAPFLAKITAVLEVDDVFLYSWIEQAIEPTDGSAMNADPARQGTATVSPAYEVNNDELTSFPVLVWLRFRAMVGGAPTYEFIGSAPGGPGGPSICQPDYLIERDLRCEEADDGEERWHVWARRVRIALVDGCLQFLHGSWYVERVFGCCGCDGSTPPPVPYPPPGPGPGPTPSPCVPALCAYCDDPPYLWYVLAETFSGICEVFNGGWSLLPSVGCEWADSVVINGQVVTVTLVVGSESATLSFVYGPPTDPIATASYTASLTGTNCCTAITFELPVCGCDDDTSPGEPCCDPVPDSWTVHASGFTEDLEQFSDDWVLNSMRDLGTCDPGTCDTWQINAPANPPPEGPCSYPDVRLTGVEGLFLSNTSSVVTLSIVTLCGGVVYKGTIVEGDCCTPITLTRSYVEFTEVDCGATPATVLVVPSCVGAGGPRSSSNPVVPCPPTILAVPFCCGGGSGIGTVLTACCAPEIPEVLVAIVHDESAGGCSCLDDVEVTITYNVTLAWWFGRLTPVCTDKHLGIAIWCDGVTWKTKLRCGPVEVVDDMEADGPIDGETATDLVCSPFAIEAPTAAEKVCCVGLASFSVMEVA
jgi:hypothetical protein